MKNREIIIKYCEYGIEEELPPEDARLIDAANEATQSSYSPYSEFKVGAALYLKDGSIVKGSNQENSAYPSGLCAERVALFHAKSINPDSIIESIAITASTSRFDINEPITPCGACRQVIAETEKRQNSKIRIIMTGEGCSTRIVDGIDDLLPFKFQEDKLKKTK